MLVELYYNILVSNISNMLIFFISYKIKNKTSFLFIYNMIFVSTNMVQK